MLCYLRQMQCEGFIWERTKDRNVKTKDCLSVNSIIYMIGLSYPIFSKMVSDVLSLGSGSPCLLFWSFELRLVGLVEGESLWQRWKEFDRHLNGLSRKKTIGSRKKFFETVFSSEKWVDYCRKSETYLSEKFRMGKNCSKANDCEKSWNFSSVESLSFFLPAAPLPPQFA